MCWRRVDSALVPGTGRVDCKDLCATWAVDHLFSRVGRPTGNALAERLIKTLKVELVWTRDWDTLEDLRRAVAAWMNTYTATSPSCASSTSARWWPAPGG